MSSASVSVGGEAVGKINQGYLILLGVGAEDAENGKPKAEKLADKISRLRIFPDENSKINLSISDIGGELLVVSQFTLYADCVKGNRPSFINAAPPQLAEELYEYFIAYAKRAHQFKKVEQGVFGASMKVELTNEGPFTVILES